MRYRILLILWFLSDILLFVAAYALAYALRVGWIFSTDFPFDQHLIVSAIVAPLSLLVLATTRTFHLTRNQATLRNGAYIAYSGVVGVALFTLAYYFTYSDFFSRLLLIYALGIQFAVTWIWHILYHLFMRRMLRRSPPVFPTLIVGVTRESKALITLLNKQKNPLTPVAILDVTGTKETEVDGVPVLGKLNKLEEVLQKFGITHLLQCSDLEQSLNLLSACKSRNITYLLLPSVIGIIGRNERIESLEGYPVTIVSPTHNWFFR